ncbi:MAG: hypothetical protein WBB07_21375 [Mycobacterium sp.]
MSGQDPSQDSSEHTRIIRRAPATPSRPTAPPAEDTRTGIIRRTPTGSIPIQHDPRTTHIPTPAEAPTGFIPAPAAPPPPPTSPRPAAPATPPEAPPAEAPTGLIAAAPAAAAGSSAHSAIAACVVAILSGWAVSVVATNLITGWWQTDRLFCLGVGFLTFVFAASTVAGVITMLLRRAVGRYLIATGAVVALLTFGAVFIAGAKIPWPVYLIPALPVASVLLAFLPATRRWTRLP